MEKFDWLCPFEESLQNINGPNNQGNKNCGMKFRSVYAEWQNNEDQIELEYS